MVARISRALPSLRRKLPVERVVLFGSYATGRYTAASDIDLLVVYREPKVRDDYSLATSALRIPGLQLHIYTSKEYRALIESSPKFAVMLDSEGEPIE